MPIWTEAEIALLGTDTDSAIAEKIGRKEKTVAQKRHRLGIKSYSQPDKRGVWNKDNTRLLGTMPDRQLARKLGITTMAVAAARYRRNIDCYSNRIKDDEKD